MTQTNNRFFDEASRLMNDAAGVAQGIRREFDSLFRTQAERVLGDLDVVRREEFEAAKDMARLAREENEALKARIAALEARIDALSAKQNSGPWVSRRSAPAAYSPRAEGRSRFRSRRPADGPVRRVPDRRLIGRPISARLPCFPPAPAAISRRSAAPAPLEAAAAPIRISEHRADTEGYPVMATIGEMKAMARPRAGKGAARAERRKAACPA